MDITVESMKRVDLVTVSGRIDSSTVAALDEVLQELQGNKRHRLVMELSAVSYMSSAGVRALVSAKRLNSRARGDTVLASPSTRVVEVLELAGLTQLFTIYDSSTTAVGSF